MLAVVTSLLIAASSMAQVLVSQISGYAAGGGGEFNVAPVVGAGYAPEVIVAGGFETFCLNREIGITIPGLYNYIVNADGSYPVNHKVTKGAAWLYSRFALGTLSGYNYTGAATQDPYSAPGVSLRMTSAFHLQLAIWTLQGDYEFFDPLLNPFLAQVADAFGGGLAGLTAASADNAPGGYNVVALELHDSLGAFVQPVLGLGGCVVTSLSCPPNITLCSGDTVPAPSTSLTAVDSCGNAVAVVFVDDVVAEGCPTVITRTYAAVNANSIQTCAQTITINCKPPCAITGDLLPFPSTSGNTLTGPAGNYTYAWSITASTGTGWAINGSTTGSAIVYTAGSSGSATIQLIVTDKVTGCQTKCGVQLGLHPGKIIGSGDTATIGFWHNKNGQALIKATPNSPALGNWLAGNYPCLYSGLAGKSNNDIAAYFLSLFNVTGQKTYAQILAVALATYETDSDLSGNVAVKYGFNVSTTGTGAKLFNVGSYGTAIGLSNNTSYTVLQLLEAANHVCPFDANEFNALNSIFDGINTTGDIK